MKKSILLFTVLFLLTSKSIIAGELETFKFSAQNEQKIQIDLSKKRSGILNAFRHVGNGVLMVGTMGIAGQINGNGYDGIDTNIIRSEKYRNKMMVRNLISKINLKIALTNNGRLRGNISLSATSVKFNNAVKLNCLSYTSGFIGEEDGFGGFILYASLDNYTEGKPFGTLSFDETSAFLSVNEQSNMSRKCVFENDRPNRFRTPGKSVLVPIAPVNTSFEFERD